MESQLTEITQLFSDRALRGMTAMAVRLDIRENDFLRHVFSQGLAEGEARGWAEARIHAASVAHLTLWLDRVLDAKSLDDVFDEPRPA